MALPRSEQTLASFECLKEFLLEPNGCHLGEIIKLTMAVETVPLGRMMARLRPDVQIPAGADGFVVPGVARY